MLIGQKSAYSFSRFVRDSAPYVDHKNRAWLQTEYNTAVNRAHQAARWQQFESEADVYPNLRWVPSTSPNPGADHKIFWDTVLPVNHPFWDSHRPGDRWNCKCDLEQSDDPVTPAPVGSRNDDPAPGLENNPAKDKRLFSNKHPYFASSCSTCPFSGSNLSALFHNLAGRKNCSGCNPLKKTIKTAKEPTADVVGLFGQLSRKDGKTHEILQKITEAKIYRNVEKRIFCAISESAEDYDRLLKVAQMTVRDNRNTVVYILPNPKSVTSMDIIIKNRQRLAAYDVKTITGTHSALNRLKESIGQTQRVLLNVTSKYRAGDLWYEIKTYFEKNQDAIEVLVYINGKKISVQRRMMSQKTFIKMCYR